MAGMMRPRDRGMKRPFQNQGRPVMGGQPKYGALMTSFMNYQDPNIGGEQPASVMGGYDQGTTMEKTKRNDWLNTLDPMMKMKAMNRMGYWSGGERVKAPRVGAAAPSQSWMNQLGDGSGGTWQYQDPSTGAYAGMVNLRDDSTGQAASYDPLRGGSTSRVGRIRRRGGTTGGMVY
jgi:hypothetical protein